jgi:hypothetical protein
VNVEQPEKNYSSMFHVEQIHRFLNYNPEGLNYKKMFLNEYDVMLLWVQDMPVLAAAAAAIWVQNLW